MYDTSNFVITLDIGNSVDLVTGGTATIGIDVSNEDVVNNLYNFSLQLQLCDGVEFISSSVEVTSISGNNYYITNIKDLAPNELNVHYSFQIKLNSTYENGTVIPFETLLQCSVIGTADTMPRGSYDNGNEVIVSTLSYGVSVSRYVIFKEMVEGMLLGDTYSTKIIIQTSQTEGVSFSEITDSLGEGILFLGNLTVTGDSDQTLLNYNVIEPNDTINYYQIVWGSIVIESQMLITIQYDIKANEKYYLNGTISGNYINNGDSISSSLQWQDETSSYSDNYTILLYEIMAFLQISQYWVDILDQVVYTITLNVNAYHSVYNILVYLNLFDGEVAETSSVPMYDEVVNSSNGNTQVQWYMSNANAGQEITITINGKIATSYISTQLPIYTGDIFAANTLITANSITTGSMIQSSASSSMQISVPTISKQIVGYYYNNQTKKTINTVAPGDYVEYLLTYDSSNIQAPSKSVGLFDFYPYITSDLPSIQYSDSNVNYPSNSPYEVDPYGVQWYMTSVPGALLFTIDAMTQIEYTNVTNQFLYNLFKLEVTNSNNIEYSNRDQVGIQTGKPNLILSTQTTGNNANAIKIGETYTISVILSNEDNGQGVTDAFSFVLTQTIPIGITLLPNSVTALIDSTSLSFTSSNSEIVVQIPQLAPGKQMILSYTISVNNTLGPNQSFDMGTQITVPYTQLYNISDTNLQYDVTTPVTTVALQSAPIAISASCNDTTPVIGDNVIYSYQITFPEGIKLASYTPLYVMPNLNTFTGSATLNGNSITGTVEENYIFLPTVTSIDTTGGAITDEYEVVCNITDASVLTTNPQYTVETFYCNLQYTTLLSQTYMIGVNSSFNVEHPYVTISVKNSQTMGNYVKQLNVSNNTTIYSQVIIQNSGLAEALTIQGSIFFPEYFNYGSVVSSDPDTSVSYNSQTNVLSITTTNIEPQDSRTIVLQSNLQLTDIADSMLIINADILTYMNNVSLTKVYNSNIVDNSQLFLSGSIRFVPDSKFTVMGANGALNISKRGAPTSIIYYLTNTGIGMDSYQLQITPITIPYDVLVDGNYITTVAANTNASITDASLNGYIKNQTHTIQISYTIPLTAEEGFYNSCIITAISALNSNVEASIPTGIQDP